jgi:hypothetical protein
VREIAGRFSSPLHHESVAARLGPWLGTAFAVAFVAGVFSHFTQRPPDWLVWPSHPVNLYRITQGVHVIGGLATIPGGRAGDSSRLPLPYGTNLLA